MARGSAFRIAATLLAAASMLTPAVATDGIGFLAEAVTLTPAVDDLMTIMSCPPTVDRLPDYLTEAADAFSTTVIEEISQKTSKEYDLTGWRSFSSTANVNSKKGRFWISPEGYRYTNVPKIIERLRTGKTPSALKKGKFRLPKLKMKKAMNFKGDDALSEAKAQIDTFNAHVDEIDAQRAASGLQT